VRQYTNDPLSCSYSHVDVACSAPPVRCLLASWIACLPVATRVLRIQAPLSAPPHHAPAAFDCTRVVRPPSRQVPAHLRPALKPPAHGGSTGMPLLPANAGHLPPHLKSAHKSACLCVPGTPRGPGRRQRPTKSFEPHARESTMIMGPCSARRRPPTSRQSGMQIALKW